ncbi:5-methyltetrahydropteroyltriglutamate--homocysteine S-methyltransferase [Caviibacter abscessus]|uniref:5-methyltetrahydropteroyltriglutamate-- homocysteine S-methyltransferase n=1 Tax=Caviibacter abscessus TaxID=1766719 RepID=UPI00082B8F12|nr:5-methyltetrahydropteroyltriglutamate--homocysteine S-methyltransferase [Caviibacter abscessus]
MKASVVAYPRIGENRELKFAVEKYFNKHISEEELKTVAKNLRKAHLKSQSENNIEYISSNDFSYYDRVLDVANMLNIIPSRYKNLKLNELDTYFSMARGYQGINGDVCSLSMKKWFNTNYHYIVPEIEDDANIYIKNNKIFDEYLEAKEFKPTIIGPFTLMKLSTFAGTKTKYDFLDSFINTYTDILKRLRKLDVKWFQIEEPYLVCELDKDDIYLFKTMYSKILENKGNVKVLLQTYFGDISHIFSSIYNMNFDAFGLDFVEGKNNLDIFSKYNLLDKVIFAGVINGKNVWKADLDKIFTILSKIKENSKEVVVSTSCSLIHIPYTIENEKNICKNMFSFAKEKLVELETLKKYVGKNRENITEIIQSDNNIKYEKRKSIIKNNILLPITTIGSFPQTEDIKNIRKKYLNNVISKEKYEEFIKLKIKECIVFQEEIGIDILVHGEFERNDMVEYFYENLLGFVFTKNGWVQSYGTRCVKPPIINSDIKRKKSITLKWILYAKSLTNKPMKAILTGPITILNWSFKREDISQKDIAFQIAKAINEEVLELEKNGIDIIQIDEPAIREKLPLKNEKAHSDYLDLVVQSFRMSYYGIKETTKIHTHICYSDFKDIIGVIDNLGVDVIYLELSKDNFSQVSKLCDIKTNIGAGIYDVHSQRIPSIEEIKGNILKISSKININKLVINPDCGLKTRNYFEIKESLKNIVCAVKQIREESK